MQDHQMSISSSLGLFAVGFIGVTIIFLVMREIFCWYVKSNKLVELVNNLNKDIQLMKFNLNSLSGLEDARDLSKKMDVFKLNLSSAHNDLIGGINEFKDILSNYNNSNASISTELCEKVEVLEARLNQIDDKLDEILEQIEQR